jgi:hypothetical protein
LYDSLIFNYNIWAKVPILSWEIWAPTTSIFPFGIGDEQIEALDQVLLDVVILEYNTYQSNTFNRDSIFIVAATFGGLMNFMLRLCNTMLAEYQAFSLTNSIIKKLYSTKPLEVKKEKDLSQNAQVKIKNMLTES